MRYNKEITDQIRIQYIILFALAKADRIVTHSQLTSLVLDNCNIKFTEFRIALDNLERIGHIRVFSPDGKITYCELLQKGREANGFFYKKIPVYIREPIEEYIKPFFNEEAEKRSVRCDILPLNEKEYMADCSVYDGSTPLMKLSLYAGTRKQAYAMLRKFKDNPQKVYEAVIDMISVAEDEAKDD